MEVIASEALPIVSAATIQRYVTNASSMDENELVPLSFAQCTTRGPCSNSESNKDLRIEKMTELDRYMRAGFTLVFVDESHWNLANVRTRKWGERGKRRYHTRSLARVQLSCICAVSDSGKAHCRLFNRTINGDIFMRYMMELMDYFAADNSNCVFIMDNAPIHKEEVVRLAQDHHHEIMFNAPYSPECNPIEMVFGFWKNRVCQLVNVDIADLIKTFPTVSLPSVRRR